MDRNLVPVRLGRGDRLRLTRMCRTNLAILKNENFAAPVHSVIGKAGEPHGESYQVSDWHQPQMPPKGAIMHDSNANLDRDGGTQSRSRGECCPGPPTKRREQDGKNRPGQAEGEKQANIAETARIARAAGPAHLVLKKSAEAVRGQMSFDNNIRQHDFIPSFSNAKAQLKIVSQIINQRAQAADGLKRGARHGERGAKSKMNAAFNLAGNKHAGNKVRADADGFQL